MAATPGRPSLFVLQSTLWEEGRDIASMLNALRLGQSWAIKAVLTPCSKIMRISLLCTNKVTYRPYRCIAVSGTALIDTFAIVRNLTSNLISQKVIMSYTKCVFLNDIRALIVKKLRVCSSFYIIICGWLGWTLWANKAKIGESWGLAKKRNGDEQICVHKSIFFMTCSW